MTAKQFTGSTAPDGSRYVTLTDGAGNLGEGSTVLGSVTQSGTWTVQPGNTANTTAWKVDGSAVTQPTGGNVASAATDSGNPVKVSGVYNTTQPTFTNGQRGDFQIDANGNQRTSELDALLIPAASVTSAATIFSVDTTGYSSIDVQFTSVGGSNTITWEGSNDNSTWLVAPMQASTTSTVGMTFLPSGAVSNPVTTSHYSGPLIARYFRARVSTYGSGTVTALAYLRKTPTTFYPGSIVGQAASGATVAGNPVRIGKQARSSNITAVTSGQVADGVATLVGVDIQKPYSIPEADWNYAAAASGISNTTTAVTVQAAAAAGIRNYITSMQISSGALGAATEFAIRDGAGGTVLWRMTIGTAGIVNGLQINFPSPLKSTAATLLEVVTLTASITGAVYVNLQGYAAP